MRRLRRFVSGSLLALALTACGPATAHRGLPPPEALTLAAPVSIAMDTQVGPPVVPVLLNGRGPYRVIVDTGAAGTVIAEPLARELGLPEQARASMGAGGSGRRVPATLTRLETVTLDDLELAGVAAVFGDLSVAQRVAPDVQGVLGAGTLDGLLLTFDYPAGRLRVEPGELPAADGRTIFEWPAEDAVPSLPVDVAGLPLRMDLDTGANGGFVLAAGVEQQLDWLEPLTDGRPLRTVDGETATRDGRLRGRVRIGEHDFVDPAASVRADGDRSRVGYALLKDFVVTLDARNRRVRLRGP